MKQKCSNRTQIRYWFDAGIQWFWLLIQLYYMAPNKRTFQFQTRMHSIASVSQILSQKIVRPLSTDKTLRRITHQHKTDIAEKLEPSAAAILCLLSDLDSMSRAKIEKFWSQRKLALLMASINSQRDSWILLEKKSCSCIEKFYNHYYTETIKNTIISLERRAVNWQQRIRAQSESIAAFDEIKAV